MNLLRGVLQLRFGGWVVDDRVHKWLVYRKEMGAATIRVPYIVNDAGYLLRRTAEIDSDRLLMDENALSIVSEIAQQVQAAGFSAQVEELTGFHRKGPANSLLD